LSDVGRVVHKGEKDHPSGKAADALASLDDNSLAAELIRGRHEAFAVLFKRHSHMVFRAARRILGDSGEAEEVVQQTFLEAFQHIVEFDPTKGSFIQWLLKRAKSRAADHRDHLNVERFYDWTTIDETLTAASGDRNRILYRQEIEPVVDELLHKLPFRQRKVLRLSFFEGRTAEEIAIQMNDSVWGVRRLLYEALRRLRSSVAQKGSAGKQAKDK
jgi:RNA polymerase sigma-70 factor (ECF subfamily)